jgi:hypothetical protein
MTHAHLLLIQICMRHPLKFLQLPMQWVPITTDVVGSTPALDQVYNIM